jgi:hypothetical protein
MYLCSRIFTINETNCRVPNCITRHTKHYVLNFKLSISLTKVTIKLKKLRSFFPIHHIEINFLINNFNISRSGWKTNFWPSKRLIVFEWQIKMLMLRSYTAQLMTSGKFSSRTGDIFLKLSLQYFAKVGSSQNWSKKYEIVLQKMWRTLDGWKSF